MRIMLTMVTMMKYKNSDMVNIICAAYQEGLESTNAINPYLGVEIAKMAWELGQQNKFKRVNIYFKNKRAVELA